MAEKRIHSFRIKGWDLSWYLFKAKNNTKIWSRIQSDYITFRSDDVGSLYSKYSNRDRVWAMKRAEWIFTNRYAENEMKYRIRRNDATQKRKKEIRAHYRLNWQIIE